MLPPAIALVRSTADLMNTKLPPQKMATLNSRMSATIAIRRELCIIVAGVAIAAAPYPRNSLEMPPRSSAESACERSPSSRAIVEIDAAHERVDRQALAEARRAAGGQHVVGARRVVGEGRRGVPAKEDRPGAADLLK